MNGYTDPDAVWVAPSGVKVDPHNSAFNANVDNADDNSLPIIYIFSAAPDGDGPAYAMAEDGTILGSHICSHWGYMRHDLHERGDRRQACATHYPQGYRLMVLTEPGSLPPPEVIERNRAQGEAEEQSS